MKHEETQLHITVVHYLRTVHPGLLFFHPLNGGFAFSGDERERKRQGAKFKAMAVLPGLPDLGFPMAGKPINWIELKTLKGRLSDEQADVINRLRRLGCEVEICRSLDAVIATLDAWGIVGRRTT